MKATLIGSLYRLTKSTCIDYIHHAPMDQRQELMVAFSYTLIMMELLPLKYSYA